MNAVDVMTEAQKMVMALGPQALVDATRKARDMEDRGDAAQARDWRRIAAAINTLRGPRVS